MLLALYARAVIPSFGTPRPAQLVRPELAGVIESSDETGPDSVLVVGGRFLTLTDQADQVFGPSHGVGDLLLYGETADGAWYATAASRPEDPGCFVLGSSPFYAAGQAPYYGDQREVVVVGDRELGVVLPKAAGFDPAGARPDLETGAYQLEYTTACANERGEIVGFRS